jgi:hypothetical protein
MLAQITLVAGLLLAGCGGSSSSHTAAAHEAVGTSAAVVAQSQTRSAQASHPTRPTHASKARGGTAAARPRARAHQNPATAKQPSNGTATTTRAQPASSPGPSRSAQNGSQITAFRTAYLQAIGPLKQSAQEIGAALRTGASHTRNQNLHAFRALYSSWRSDLGALLHIRPPAKFVRNVSTLTGAGTHVKSDLSEIVAAITARRVAAAGGVISRIVVDLGAAKTADATLEQKLASATK